MKIIAAIRNLFQSKRKESVQEIFSAEEKFLNLLAQTPRVWERRPALRCHFGGKYHCPLSAAASLLNPSPFICSAGYPFEAGAALGLNKDQIARIVYAADGVEELRELRRKLLQACGF